MQKRAWALQCQHQQEDFSGIMGDKAVQAFQTGKFKCNAMFKVEKRGFVDNRWLQF